MRKFNVRWWAGPKLSQWRMMQVLSMYDPGPFAVHGIGWVRAFPLTLTHCADVQEGGKIRLIP